jgi:glutamyl-tRNA reductase
VTTSADTIIAFVAHARHVPASNRQRFKEALTSEFARGGLLLETCHRVEMYATLEGVDAGRCMAATVSAGGRVLRGSTAIRHALSVAVGRDSVVVGEDQVLHQLRQALDAARAAGSLDPALERLFAVALRAGRQARSWRQGRPLSLADVAVDLIEREAGALSGRELLVVGAGKMGALAADAGVAAGARVAVSSRSPERAAQLARPTRARVEDFDPGGRLGTFAGIVVALAGPWPLGTTAIDALARGSTFVVDLSVPAAVPEELAIALGRRLTTADDLARSERVTEPIPDRTLARLDALIDRTGDEFIAWLGGRERRAAARALVERADRERQAELADLWRRLPDLDPEARATIEGMSRHLAERLLREPLERLRADADGRHERAVRELWAL